MIAHRRPDLVRQVITVSSPFAGHGKATNVWRAFEWATGERLDDPAVLARSAAIAAPLPVPAAAICRDAHGETIEISSSHLGVQVRPDVLLAVARLLAAKAGDRASRR